MVRQEFSAPSGVLTKEPVLETNEPGLRRIQPGSASQIQRQAPSSGDETHILD
jgi:hypothetical protein